MLCKINLISIFVSWSIDSKFLQRRDFLVKHFFANFNQFASKTWQNVFMNSSKKDTFDWKFVVKTQCEMHARLSSMNWLVVCFFHFFSSRHFVRKSKFFRCSSFRKSIDFVQMYAMFELLDSRNIAIQQSRCTWKFRWKRVVFWDECASCVEMNARRVLRWMRVVCWNVFEAQNFSFFVNSFSFHYMFSSTSLVNIIFSCNVSLSKQSCQRSCQHDILSLRIMSFRFRMCWRCRNRVVDLICWIHDHHFKFDVLINVRQI